MGNEENKQTIPEWLQSSTGEGIAARWKAFASGVVPVLALVGPYFGITIVPDDLNSVVEGIGTLIVSVWAALSAGYFVFGTVRAMYYKRNGLGKFAK